MRAEVRGVDGFADEVGFADPGALRVGEDDGDGVAGALESGDEGMDIGGRLVRRRTVVVGYLSCKGEWLVMLVVVVGLVKAEVSGDDDAGPGVTRCLWDGSETNVHLKCRNCAN